MPEARTIAVLGAGSWGTALAAALARNGHDVRLWGRDPDRLQAMAGARENTRYLPGIPLADNIRCEADFERCVDAGEALLLAVPTAAMHDTLQRLAALGTRAPLAWSCKGLEPGTGRFMHELIEQALPGTQYALVSGPTFAAEVARGLPAAVTVAARDLASATWAAQWIHGETLRAYPSGDVLGVELGGALKNVLAIAAGISDGLGFGANARAALITRGLAELMRLGESLGAQRDTLMGLAGLGDLVLTCTDDQSRNRRFGLCLADGLSREAALARIGQAVEGVNTAAEAQRLAVRHGVEMPIVHQVHAIIHEGRAPRDAVHALLARTLKAESS